MLGPQPHGRIRSESGTQKFVSPHAQEEGGESCEKGHFLKKNKKTITVISVKDFGLVSFRFYPEGF